MEGNDSAAAEVKSACYSPRGTVGMYGSRAVVRRTAHSFPSFIEQPPFVFALVIWALAFHCRLRDLAFPNQLAGCFVAIFNSPSTPHGRTPCLPDSFLDWGLIDNIISACSLSCLSPRPTCLVQTSFDTANFLSKRASHSFITRYRPNDQRKSLSVVRLFIARPR